MSLPRQRWSIVVVCRGQAGTNSGAGGAYGACGKAVARTGPGHCLGTSGDRNATASLGYRILPAGRILPANPGPGRRAGSAGARLARLASQAPRARGVADGPALGANGSPAGDGRRRWPGRDTRPFGTGFQVMPNGAGFPPGRPRAQPPNGVTPQRARSSCSQQDRHPWAADNAAVLAADPESGRLSWQRMHSGKACGSRPGTVRRRPGRGQRRTSRSGTAWGPAWLQGARRERPRRDRGRPQHWQPRRPRGGAGLRGTALRRGVRRLGPAARRVHRPPRQIFG